MHALNSFNVIPPLDLLQDCYAVKKTKYKYLTSSDGS